jgi:ribosomal protein L35
MPKMKTHKTAAKRIGKTGSGKLIRVKAWRGTTSTSSPRAGRAATPARR